MVRSPRVRMRRSAALLLVAAASGLAHEARALEDDARRSQVLIEADEIRITVGDVEDLLAQQAPTLRVRYEDRSQLKELVEGMLRMELLAREAERRGYAKHPAVVRTVKESAAQALVRAEIEEKLTPASIPEALVRAYYEAHASEFQRPALRRASYLVVDTKAEAERLLPEAKKADMRGFAELIKQHGKAPGSKEHGGDLGYFAREQSDAGGQAVPPTLRKVAFELPEVGATSVPVELDGRYAILRLTGERPERHLSVDDAAPSIRARLWRDQRQRALEALFAKLRARDEPEVHPERVEAISFDDMEKRPTGFAPNPHAAPSSDAAAPKH